MTAEGLAHDEPTAVATQFAVGVTIANRTKRDYPMHKPSRADTLSAKS